MARNTYFDYKDNYAIMNAQNYSSYKVKQQITLISTLYVNRCYT